MELLPSLKISKRWPTHIRRHTRLIAKRESMRRNLALKSTPRQLHIRDRKDPHAPT
jgi:hypothetical protein